MRQNGFYWILWQEMLGWTVAEYKDGSWICNQACSDLKDKEIEVILEEKIPYPQIRVIEKFDLKEGSITQNGHGIGGSIVK